MYLSGILNRNIKIDDAVRSRKAAIARLAPVQIKPFGTSKGNAAISVAVADLQKANIKDLITQIQHCMRNVVRNQVLTKVFPVASFDSILSDCSQRFAENSR